MKLLVCHPGASWAVSDVHTGLVAGLKAGGHEVVEYALDGRVRASRVTLEWLWRSQVRHGGPLADERPTAADVQYHASKDVVERALRHEVDWVLVVCAAYLHPDVLVLCRRAGVKTAAVFTESPYDDAQQAKVAPLFDVCFTNERVSAPLLRAFNPHTFYLPVGYDPETHGGEREPEDAPAHDVVFVGTGFESRLALLGAVDWDGVDLGLYGFWEGLTASHPLRPYVHEGLVDNARTGALYRAARLGLNLYRGTGGAAADSLNPRAYELAADGVFTLSTPRAEVFERFGPAVPTFTSPTELQALVRHFLRFDQTREQLAEKLPGVVTQDTYHHRAAELVGRLAA